MENHASALPLTVPLHHAYCAVGEAARIAPRIKEFFEREFGFAARGNPDFWHGEYATFGIGEARLLKEAAGQKAFGDGKKLFIISCGSMTKEAQNALLKTLEEPAPDTYFFLLLPSASGLLTTLRSRLFLITLAVEKALDSSSFTRAFLVARPPRRLALLAEKFGALDDEARSREEMRAFFHSLERVLAAAPRDAEVARALLEVLLCARYGLGRSPSQKILSEHLALTLPTVM